MSLEQYRKQIDKINNDILTLLKKRMLIVKKIKLYKQKHNMKGYQPKREKIMLNKIAAKGKDKSLPPQQIKEIFRKIVKMARDSQQ